VYQASFYSETLITVIKSDLKKMGVGSKGHPIEEYTISINTVTDGLLRIRHSLLESIQEVAVGDAMKRQGGHQL